MAYVGRPALLPSDFGFPESSNRAPTSAESAGSGQPTGTTKKRTAKPNQSIRKKTKLTSAKKKKSSGGKKSDSKKQKTKKRALPWKV